MKLSFELDQNDVIELVHFRDWLYELDENEGEEVDLDQAIRALIRNWPKIKLAHERNLSEPNND